MLLIALRLEGLLLLCNLEAHVSWYVCWECRGGSWAPTIPLLSDCHFPADPHRLALDLNSGCLCGELRRSARRKMKMKWASLPKPGLHSILCSTPPPTKPPNHQLSSVSSSSNPPSSPPYHPPLGNQCALSFCGTRRHIDLAVHTLTCLHTHRDCCSDM